MTYEIMTVSYTELDNTCPAICICSDLIIPITNKSFPKNFIGFYDKDIKFNINNLSGCSIKFKIIDEENEILEFYYKTMFVGYVSMSDIYTVFIQCYNELINRE